jgi:hypothetical protein
VPLTGDKTDLQNLQNALTPNLIDPALLVHRQFNGLPHGRTSFRTIVQADHQPWQTYRRTKMQEAVELGICNRYSKWRVVPDNANLEFWVQQIDKQALIGLRLTDRTMRHRTYKIANLPASLRPTIARAMVHLSQPAPDDIFLDPMCGAGTLLIERALAGRYALLQGVTLTMKPFKPRWAILANTTNPMRFNSGMPGHCLCQNNLFTKWSPTPPGDGNSVRPQNCARFTPHCVRKSTACSNPTAGPSF